MTTTEQFPTMPASVAAARADWFERVALAEAEATEIFAERFARYEDVADAIGYTTDQFSAGLLSAAFVAGLAS